MGKSYTNEMLDRVYKLQTNGRRQPSSTILSSMQLLQTLRAIRLSCVVFLLPGSLATVHGQPTVTLTPAIVVAGSPELIRVAVADAASVDGEWLGRKLQFFPSRDGRAWLALAGVDVEAPAGSSTLHISIHTSSGASSRYCPTGRDPRGALSHRKTQRGAEVC